MTRKHFVTIADSLGKVLAQSNDKDFTYSRFRQLCAPFITGLEIHNDNFDEERFIAYAYDRYREYRRAINDAQNRVNGSGSNIK